MGYDDEDSVRVDFLIKKILEAFFVDTEGKILKFLSTAKVVGSITKESLI